MKTATKKTSSKNATKKAPAKRTAKAKSAKAPAKKMSQIEAAEKVLDEAKEPMNCKAMVEAMAKRKLWSSPNGKTPEATPGAWGQVAVSWSRLRQLCVYASPRPSLPQSSSFRVPGRSWGQREIRFSNSSDAYRTDCASGHPAHRD